MTQPHDLLTVLETVKGMTWPAAMPDRLADRAEYYARLIIDMRTVISAAIAAAKEQPTGRLTLKRDTSRASWDGADVRLTFGEFRIVDLLTTSGESFVSYRAVYDRLRYQGFVAGEGADGFRGNVRSAIKRIRIKFRAIDSDFDAIENYTGFGYRWRVQS